MRIGHMPAAGRQRDLGAGHKRLSRGEVARRARSLRRLQVLAIAATAAASMGLATGAEAACSRPNGPGPSVFNFLPLASGSTVASIISTIGAVNTSSLAQSTAFVGVPPGAKPNEQGGGNWSRVIVGEVETKSNTQATGTVNLPPFGNINDANDCRSTNSLEFYGSQAGMDIGHFNFGNGGNLHFGITAGYFDIKSKDKTAGLGQFRADGEIPFAGLYMALSSGNFSFDAQLRGDFFQLSMSDVDNGMFKQDITATTIALLWNAAYRFDLPNRWFVETSVGGVSSRTAVDSFGVAGGINVPAAVTPSFTLPGIVQIDDINSLLGRASVRVGTVITTGNLVLSPFGTASIFHEFAGNVRTNINAPDLIGGGASLTGTLTTDRVGTYGHLGLGIAGTVVDTGWLGYARVDYRFGDNLEGLSFNAGLRYQWQPPRDTTASLKDGETAAYKPSVFNWTGLYAGWSSGAMWASQDWTFETNGARVDPDVHGYLVGGQIGYNFQHGRTVFGVEADYNWSSGKGGKSCPNAFFFTCNGEIDSISFITGRVGYAHERALFYVRAGLAIADVTVQTVSRSDQLVNPLNVPNAVLVPTAGSSTTSMGWVIGAGIEFAVSDRWTVKGEWLHFDLGSERYTVSANLPVKADTTGDVARIGVNYHFGHRGSLHESDPLK